MICKFTYNTCVLHSILYFSAKFLKNLSTFTPILNVQRERVVVYIVFFTLGMEKHLQSLQERSLCLYQQYARP